MAAEMRTGEWTRRWCIIGGLLLAVSALSLVAMVVGGVSHVVALQRTLTSAQPAEDSLALSGAVLNVAAPIAVVTSLAFWIAMLLHAVAWAQGSTWDAGRCVWTIVVGATGWFGAAAYCGWRIHQSRRPTGLPSAPAAEIATRAATALSPHSDEGSAAKACLLDTAVGRYATLPLAVLVAAFTVLFLIGFLARPDLLFEFGTLGRALIGLAIVFWVLMIVDAVQRLVRDTRYPRLHWLLAVLLTGVLGAVAYYGWRVRQSLHGGAAPIRHGTGDGK
jgi:hypothetical protein